MMGTSDPYRLLTREEFDERVGVQQTDRTSAGTVQRIVSVQRVVENGLSV